MANRKTAKGHKKMKLREKLRLLKALKKSKPAFYKFDGFWTFRTEITDEETAKLIRKWLSQED